MTPHKFLHPINGQVTKVTFVEDFICQTVYSVFVHVRVFARFKESVFVRA